jgi:hypothetical protein
MPPAQDQCLLDAVELFRVVDLRGFERVELRKHEGVGVRKEALAPPR